MKIVSMKMLKKVVLAVALAVTLQLPQANALPFNFSFIKQAWIKLSKKVIEVRERLDDVDVFVGFMLTPRVAGIVTKNSAGCLIGGIVTLDSPAMLQVKKVGRVSHHILRLLIPHIAGTEVGLRVFLLTQPYMSKAARNTFSKIVHGVVTVAVCGAELAFVCFG